MEPNKNEPLRKKRTPETAAHETMGLIQDLWLAVAPNATESGFDDAIDDLCSGDLDIDSLTKECIRDDPSSARERGSWPYIEKPLRLAYACSILAELAYLAGENDEAWSHIEDASYWHGMCVGFVYQAKRGLESQTISDIAKRAAHVRNAENRALMMTAFDWLDQRFKSECSSMDQAAEKLTRVVPVAFRTARRYVTMWKSSRPSARSM